jgi:hypothetical protein
MENTPDPSTAHTPDPGVANTPNFNMANTPAPICDECGSSPAPPAQFAMLGRDGETNPKPWCEECIMDSFDLARVGNKISAQISTPSLTAFPNRTRRVLTHSS